MRPVIAAFTAVLILTGTGVRAQDKTGTAAESGAVPADAGSAPGKPAIGIDRPKLTPKMVIDAFNVLTQPRPGAAADSAAPAPAGPAVVAAAPAPTTPAGATGVATTPALAPAAGQPSQAVPRPITTTAPRPAASAVLPLRPQVEPARPAPAARPAPGAAPEVTPPTAALPIPSAAPASFMVGTAAWLLIGLLAAAAVAGSVVRVRRTRRLGRTRAALTLKPRLDLSAGASSLSGLSLASPPFAIRARLALGD